MNIFSSYFECLPFFLKTRRALVLKKIFLENVYSSPNKILVENHLNHNLFNAHSELDALWRLVFNACLKTRYTSPSQISLFRQSPHTACRLWLINFHIFFLKLDISEIYASTALRAHYICDSSLQYICSLNCLSDQMLSRTVIIPIIIQCS